MSKINLRADVIETLGEDVAEFIPVSADEKDLLNDNVNVPDTVPILPLRNTVLFPGVIIPINIGRFKSLHLIQDAYKQGDYIVRLRRRGSRR